MASRRQKECDHCGESIPQRSLACPHCGSDAQTGWADSEELEYQSVEIPESWPEGEGSLDGRSNQPRWVRVTVVIVLLALFVLIRYGFF